MHGDIGRTDVNRQTKKQRNWSAAQGALSGAAFVLLGIAIASGELHLGSIVIPSSIPFGTAIMLAGAAYAVASLLTLNRRR
ncbi:hypothetical protein GCM10009674_07340 [Nesterenkonia xinjiangensis]